MSKYTFNGPVSNKGNATYGDVENQTNIFNSDEQETIPKNNEDKDSNDKMSNRKKIFVVHGRNAKIRTAMFSFLRAVGLEPIEWDEAKAMTGSATPFIGEILEAAFARAQAILVLFTPDDEARLKEEFLKLNDKEYEKNLTPQARPNVLFEAGMAMGSHPERTVLVEFGELRPFSDIAGRHCIRMSNNPQSRMSLVNALKTAGLEVSIEGKTDYFQTGDFDCM